VLNGFAFLIQVHNCFELQPRAVKSALDSAWREVGDLSDLGVAQALDFAQHDEGTVLLIERFHGALEDAFELLAQNDLVGPSDAGADGIVQGGLVDVFDGLALLGLAPGQILDPVLGVVRRDAEEPRGEFGLATEGVDGAKDGDEDLLRQIFGLSGVAQHAIDKVVDLVLMQGNQLSEGRLVALLEQPDELVFLLGRHAGQLTPWFRAGVRHWVLNDIAPNDIRLVPTSSRSNVSQEGLTPRQRGIVEAPNRLVDERDGSHCRPRHLETQSTHQRHLHAPSCLATKLGAKQRRGLGETLGTANAAG